MLPGIVREGLTLNSQVLRKSVRYTIYLPYDYETSTRSYPVIYMLHGNPGNDTCWVSFGEANQTADKNISSRTVPPMILVMPDGGNSRYINNFDRSVCYEDFFFQEFIPEIESQYRIKPEKWFRGILGLSMGGYGALVYALKHPELFCACVALSASIYTDEMIINMTDEQWSSNRASAHGAGLKGEFRLNEHYKSYDPFRLIQKADAEMLKTVRLYLDCGDKDFRNEGYANFHILLRRKKVLHEYRVREGGHTWSYWRSGLPEGLKFIGNTFRKR